MCPRPRIGIRLSLLTLTRPPPSNAPTLHVSPPPLSQRLGRTGQHHLGTVPSYVLQLRARQLVHVRPASWVGFAPMPQPATRGYDRWDLPLTQALGTELRQGDQPDRYGRTADVSRL